jgi:hypothetical protein
MAATVAPGVGTTTTGEGLVEGGARLTPPASAVVEDDAEMEGAKNRHPSASNSRGAAGAAAGGKSGNAKKRVPSAPKADPKKPRKSEADRLVE